MPSRPPTFRPPHAVSGALNRQAYDAKRRIAQPWRSWYSLAIWEHQLRPAQLARQPLCERCLAEGFVCAASVVNHRAPHRGDWSRFIDPSNHESTCKPHHDRDIQREEASQRGRGA